MGQSESKYRQDNVDNWKEKVSFAVTGRSATGKSTFINKIRNVTANDPGFAESGSGNTTITPKAYQYPLNERIVFFDLPGIGTMEFSKDGYVSKMRLKQYNYFLIFFDKVVSEDDHFLVCELLKLKKSFCLIRSKIDEDLRNAAEDDIGVDDVLPAIRKKINDQVSCSKHLSNTDAVFLISSRTKKKGDWNKLLEHIGKICQLQISNRSCILS